MYVIDSIFLIQSKNKHFLIVTYFERLKIYQKNSSRIVEFRPTFAVVFYSFVSSTDITTKEHQYE
jgi:hypothetical protein